MRCDVCGGGSQFYCVECLRDRIRHGFRYEFVALAEQSAVLHRDAAAILDQEQVRGRRVISGSRVEGLQARVDAARQACTTVSAAIARRRAENEARRVELGGWADCEEEIRQRGKQEMQQLATAIKETDVKVAEKRANLLTAVGTLYGLRRRRSRKGDGHDYFLGGVILPSLDSARLHHAAVRWASLQRAADLAALAAYYCSATLPFEIRLTGSSSSSSSGQARVVGITIDGKTCLPSEDFGAYARVAAMLVCDLAHLCRKRRTARDEEVEAGAGRGHVSMGRLLYAIVYGEAMDCQAITLRGVEATLLQVPVHSSYDSEWDLV